MNVLIHLGGRQILASVIHLKDSDKIQHYFILSIKCHVI